MRLAHYSDVHVTHRALGGSASFKSLAATGAYALAGHRMHFGRSDERLSKLLEDVDALGVEHSVCTGDLTGVSSNAELTHAANVFGTRLRHPERYTVLPGNHDRYAREATGLFERHFSSLCEGGHFPFVKHLTGGVTLVCIDVSHPTSLLDSSGWCGPEQREALSSVLTDDSLKGRFVVLALHYALLRADGSRDAFHHRLRDDLELLELIDREDVTLELVLHGHLHHPFVVHSKRRTIINAGSVTDLRQGGGGYNVYEIDPAEGRVQLLRRTWNPEAGRYEAALDSPLNRVLTGSGRERSPLPAGSSAAPLLRSSPPRPG